MHYLLHHRNGRSQQVARVASPKWPLLLVCIVGMITPASTLGQPKSYETGSFSLCNRNEAVGLVRQMIDATRSFDNDNRRIAVLIRAADLLWPLQQDKARATFTEAFELAVQNEKEKSEAKDRPRALVLLMASPDLRYVVIRAVAKRDSAWAKKLLEQMLSLDRQNSEQTSTRDLLSELLTAQRLLDSAMQMMSTDLQAAVDLAKASLNYPATVELTRFLYRLAEQNQQMADQFYDQALIVYADRPMREFLYLQAYPFAFRESGETPVFGSYLVPSTFVSNNSVQHRFVKTLLRRALKALEIPLDDGDNYRSSNGSRMPGIGHILQALVRIEPHVRKSMPDLSAAVVEAREKILVSLPVETQNLVLDPGREVSSPPEKGFAELIETAEKTPDVHRRDELIATAVLSDAADKESLVDVVAAVEKINDSAIRAPLLEWFYFRRAKEAAKGKQFQEAERLTSKLEGRPQRAYLHVEIAKGLMTSSETQTHAREVLDEAVTEANKAGMTIFAARTLLTASNLYAKIDIGRSLSILGEAINCINHIESPDFSLGDQTLVRQIKTNHFSRELRFFMPGLDPENGLRELAKIDFDDALAQTNTFTDKFQRAMTTLAVADVCLQRPPPKSKEKPQKKAKP